MKNVSKAGKVTKVEQWRRARLIDGNPEGKSNSNQIITARYNWITFLPKAIMEQFRKKSNFFFLFMVIIQLVFPVPTNPSLYILTFIIILFVSICKSGYEDLLRHRSDDQVNNQPVHLVSRQGCTVQKSKSLSVGQVVRLEGNENVPADLLLLAAVSSTENFVQKAEITTANLDGEPNLKIRQCALRLPPSQVHEPSAILEAFFQYQITVEFDEPNPDLYKFSGRLSIDQPDDGRDQSALPLTMGHVMLRGTTVKNATFVYGLVLYTGKDTRLSLNTSAPRLGKFSLVDTSINRLITIMALVLVILTTVGVAGCFHWHETKSPGAWYLPEFDGDDLALGIVTTFLLIVLFSGIIPISLSVSVEIQKFMASLFFGWDEALHCTETGEPPLSNNSDVVEELGQIDYLLADKTGTLTDNNLNFICCSIGGRKYDYLSVNEKFQLYPLPSLDSPSATRLVQDFFQALALCHTVQAITTDGSLHYQGMSSDEEILVGAAHALGVTFCGEDVDGKLILDESGTQSKYTRHLVFEFDSDRKCMSVIVEDAAGRFFLFCKGAESAILPKCVTSSPTHLVQKTLADATEFAKTGLRTLMIAVREISKSEFDHINSTVSRICPDPLALNAFYAEAEMGLNLLGATGVEDKLQQGVPETLNALKLAGIHIWMLTGDKMETALNIALTSGLISCNCTKRCIPDQDGSNSCIVNLTNIDSAEELTTKLRAVERNLNPTKSHSLVLDGMTFGTGFQHCRMLMAQVTMASGQIVFCRMTPLQKAQVAKLAKGEGFSPFRVCAVGDGGNDVAMIQAAHVAIGILGKEGRQAARAADFAVPKFYHLQRAILVHGSWNYTRLATLVNFFFYRAFITTIPQLIYAIKSAFSGQPIFDATFMMFFSLAFSSLPVLTYGVTERRHSAHELLTSPELYRKGRGNAHMSWKWTLYYVGMIAWHSFLVMYLPGILWGEELGLLDWAANSHMVSALVVLVTDLKLVMRTVSFNWLVLFSQVFSFGSMLIFYILTSEVFGRAAGGLLKYAYFPLLSTPGFWCLCILVAVLAIVPDLIGGAMRRTEYIKKRLSPGRQNSVMLDDISSRVMLV